MKIKYSNFVAAFALAFISVLAASAQAEWKTVTVRHDNMGHVTYVQERSKRGDARIETFNYFAGTNVVNTQRRTVKKVDGSVSVVFERRDRQNRVVYISNEYFNAGGDLFAGTRQRWTYRDQRETRGLQSRERFDRTTGNWRRS